MEKMDQVNSYKPLKIDKEVISIEQVSLGIQMVELFIAIVAMIAGIMALKELANTTAAVAESGNIGVTVTNKKAIRLKQNEVKKRAEDGPKKIDRLTIILGVLGGLAGLAALTGVAWFIIKKNRKQKKL